MTFQWLQQDYERHLVDTDDPSLCMGSGQEMQYSLSYFLPLIQMSLQWQTDLHALTHAILQVHASSQGPLT
jgi:hypothetical protein